MKFTVVLFLLECALCFAVPTTEQTDGLTKCTDLFIPTLEPFSKRCDDHHRTCMNGTAESPMAICHACKDAFGKDPDDTYNIKPCLAIQKCDGKDEATQQLFSKQCDDLHRTCKDGTAQSALVTCPACKDAFRKDPTDTNNTKPCLDSMSCPKVDIPPNAKESLECKGTSKIGDICSFACFDEFVMKGVYQLNCTEKFEWDPPLPPRCVKTCPKLEDPLHGKIQGKCDGTAEVEDECVFTCIDIKKIKGSRVLKCKEDHKWDNPPPTCDGCSSISLHFLILALSMSVRLWC